RLARAGLTLLLLGMLTLPLMGQHITGTVSDAQSKEVLPGVNILVKGTTTGASTDANGAFELSVPSLQDTLVISFIGYQTSEVPINRQTELSITLVRRSEQHTS